MKLYLGTHEVSWLGRTEVPLFVSHRRLSRQRTWPRARCRWALDSGGFTELSLHGRWETTPQAYATAVSTYGERIKRLDWVAPQDWMCEPFMVAKTGRSVDWHQKATTESVQWLRANSLYVHIIPVLQGWQLDDYLTHVGQYAEAGIDLTREPTVGLGSVCRRQATGEIARIVSELAALGLKLHGFGVKTSGLSLYGRHLTSADSLAWSYNARRRPPIEGHGHSSCANCMTWALRWRDRVVRRAEVQQPTLWESAP